MNEKLYKELRELEMIPRSILTSEELLRFEELLELAEIDYLQNKKESE